jgi:hypothetical protein
MATELANPDLPHRLAQQAPLNELRPQLIYGGGAEGLHRLSVSAPLNTQQTGCPPSHVDGPRTAKCCAAPLGRLGLPHTRRGRAAARP